MRHVLRTFRFVALAALVLLGAGVANAGSYTRIQILLPGETAAPGTPSGKTGTPRAQTAGVPFTIAVNACDDTWTPVTSVTNVVQILASDASATLPAPASLAAGAASFTVTLNAAGSFTLYAHDQTDGTVPDGVSANLQTLVIQSFTFSTINQKNQTVGVPFTVTLTARDANGALVSGYSGWVRLKEITSYGDGRVLPDSVQLAGGTWTGGLACTRADETSINRGNVNFYAFLSNAPGKNGTSDPFTEHPGPFTRVQIVAPGQSPLPGSSSGLVGAPASQSAGLAFTVNVFATDDWWNPVLSADNVRVTSSDAAASTPVSGALVNGAHAFAVTLNTVATQTLSVGDVTNPGITSMTSAGILVIPSGADHFAFSAIPTPQVAGTQVLVTIRAVDSGNNTVPGYDGDVNLAANTGAGSIGPERVTLANGSWTGLVSLRGAGANVTLTASDFSSPAHIGQSNGFVVQPGAFAGLQVLVPGETAQGGTADGRAGTPSGQIAGSPFTLTLRAVDAWWNLVSTVGDAVALGSTDAFAGMPAETTLVNGQLLLPVRLFKTGAQRIWAQDVTTPVAHADTSSAFTVTGGSFAKVLVLAPGESPAPGTASGRTGVATDQSINYAFTVTVLATDSWWNPVGGVADVVHLGSDDPLATLGADQAMVDGRADMSVRLARGGYDQVSVSDATNPSRTGSTTQVRAISSGFHLEAAISPATARAGEPFTVTVKVTNDAGSVIQEINSFVSLEVQNASSRAAGRGTLLTTQFQLLQGQRSVSETYTFSEPIVILARDDAGNAPATSNAITIGPGQPAAIHMSSNPTWVGGNRHASVVARLVDAYENGIPDASVSFSLVSGTGQLGVADTATAADGTARVDFLSPRQPESDRVHASASGLAADYDLQVAFVDPNAAGGTMTNYPNPFHPPLEPTTLAWKLDDQAAVSVRIFTQTGDLVLQKAFERGAQGGSQGLNTWAWDGRNGRGDLVASGGYVVLVEAHGTGETLHVIRRKIAVVR
ncbi:MAG TPA: hypothetical protein VI504_07910 [Candidatus Eisenbacteria bacterium]